jgi:hypothetical protein
MRPFSILAIILLVTTAGRASEEEFLVWSEVSITSVTREDTGRVTFTAQVRDDAWRKVEAEAFGKKHALSDVQCAKLAGFPLSSIRTTHEAGYPKLGGHMVHFRFKKLFSRDGAMVEAEVIISISREKGLDVSEPREKILTEKKA